MEYLATLDTTKLYYIDESGIEHGLYSTHGWSFRGERIYANVPGSHRERTNIISASQNGKLVAPWIYQKSCTTEVVNTWLKEILLPVIPRGSVLIFDNASFHKSPLTRQLIEDAGCQLLFLPTYSPDLNPIEHIWFVLKTLLRKVLPESQNPTDTICLYTSQCCFS